MYGRCYCFKHPNWKQWVIPIGRTNHQEWSRGTRNGAVDSGRNSVCNIVGKGNQIDRTMARESSTARLENGALKSVSTKSLCSCLVTLGCVSESWRSSRTPRNSRQWNIFSVDCVSSADVGVAFLSSRPKCDDWYRSEFREFENTILVFPIDILRIASRVFVIYVVYLYTVLVYYILFAGILYV